MTYVVTEACMDVLDRSCLEDCPADCIYQGDRKMYINPVECIDCGACEQACPVEAALPARILLGTPRGASPLGPIGVDTQAVTVLAECAGPRPGTTHPSCGGDQPC